MLMTTPVFHLRQGWANGLPEGLSLSPRQTNFLAPFCNAQLIEEQSTRDLPRLIAVVG
jgi:hypothetical protein